MADTAADPQTPAPEGEDIDLEGYDGSELEEIKARMRLMEEEAATLRSLQADAPVRAPQADGAAAAAAAAAAAGGAPANGNGNGNGNGANGAAPAGAGEEMQVEGEAQEEVDKRSVYVGNVDYSATPTDISNHFAASGQINRVTIVCDKFSGHPKGFCYIEFAEPATVQNALLLNESMLCGRIITVTAKRTNIPGFNRGRGRGRGGYRGGGARGGYGYSPYSRPRGRGRGAWRGA